MSLQEITEDHIFKLLGKGRDPNYKSINVSEINIANEPFDFRKLLK